MKKPICCATWCRVETIAADGDRRKLFSASEASSPVPPLRGTSHKRSRFLVGGDLSTL